MSEQDETPQDEPRHVTAQAGLASADAAASGQQEQDELETADTEGEG